MGLALSFLQTVQHPTSQRGAVPRQIVAATHSKRTGPPDRTRITGNAEAKVIFAGLLPFARAGEENEALVPALAAWPPQEQGSAGGEAENACKAPVLPSFPVGSCRWGLRSLGDLSVAVPLF